MYLRAYITSLQLNAVKLGQSAKVYADFGGGVAREYDGRVTFIASESEFTPNNIQTEDDRQDLVYAVKIMINNDGYAKTGMFGKVKFE
jgi:HlyD family secretion protein